MGKSEGCCVRIMKYFLVFFNFVTNITGGALIGLGVYYKLESAPYTEIFKDDLIGVPFFVITVGCALFIIGFIGCCSVMCEVKVLLRVYLAIVIIILLIQVGIVAIFFSLRELVTVYLVETIQSETIEAYGGSTTTDKRITDSMDLIQRTFLCCGGDTYDDWDISEWRQSHVDTNHVPASCCQGYREGDQTCQKQDAYKVGCAKAFYLWIDSKIILISLVLCGILLTQLGLAVCGCGINSQLGNRVVPL